MSSLTELPELVGFFSYSREDDDAFKGMLSTLRDGIQRELSAQLGRSKRTFRLWQDQVAIAPGKLWESEIKTAINESFFFIPIVTPRSISSKYCKFEFESFLARENTIGRSDLIFPILYISVAALENETKWRDDPVLSTIGRRQYVDWRPLRHLDFHTTPVREQIERLCQKIVEALNAPWTSPEERQRMEEAEAKRRAEEEARRLEAEAKRRAEEEQYQEQVEAKARAEEERRRHAAKVKASESKQAAEALVARDARNGEPAEPSRRRMRVAIGVAVVAVLLLISWGGYALFRHTVERGVQQTELKREQERRAKEAEANRNLVQQEARATDLARAAAEADAKRMNEEAERIIDRLSFSDLIRRGLRESRDGDQDRAIVTFSEAIQLDAGNASGFANRGLAYLRKGDNNQAVADFNEAIRLSPQMAWALCYRGIAKLKINDGSGKADMAKARQLEGDSPCR